MLESISIRPATLTEVRLFEARQRELARWEDENGSPVDMPEDDEIAF